MPADPRAIAQEAIELAGMATQGEWGTILSPNSLTLVEHAGGIIRGASDDDARLVAHAGTHYATIAKALIEALDERDAVLADLPHALGRCGCRRGWAIPHGPPPIETWPESHTAAIARLEARIG